MLLFLVSQRYWGRRNHLQKAVRITNLGMGVTALARWTMDQEGTNARILFICCFLTLLLARLHRSFVHDQHCFA